MSLRLTMVIILILGIFVGGGAYMVTSYGSTAGPATVLSLQGWKLQLPLEAASTGQVAEVKWPALNTYSSWFFQLDKADDGVTFRAPVDGKKTPGAMFARTELRQMTADGTRTAAWSSAGSTWSMTIREAITHLPPGRPAIVAGQIHGAGSHFVALVRLDDHRLWVKTEQGSAGTLDDDYKLGTVFTVKLVARGDVISVYYNGSLKVEINEECAGCYFKAGAYLQSNTDWDDPSAYGEVTIYDLTVAHGPA